MLCSRVMEGVRTMARPDFPRTLAEFQSRFVTEDDCRRYLGECRWPDGYQCPRCAHAEAYEVEHAGTLSVQVLPASSVGDGRDDLASHARSSSSLVLRRISL